MEHDLPTDYNTEFRPGSKDSLNNYRFILTALA
jgi:hypothetical protein